jgi:4-amino-4-deoxy-L-arabinose transferase-like glycosyltransferase
MCRSVIQTIHLGNPWILYSPFLIFYVLLVVALRGHALYSDAGTYLLYAQNLLHGHYSPSQEINLWSGPGYPLILAPFLALGASATDLIMLNPIFRYLSIVYLYKTIALYASRRVALVFALFWALHFTSYPFLPNINTESLAALLVVLAAYFSSLAYQNSATSGARRYQWLAGGVLGYLALTKVIFGYVLPLALAFVTVYFLVAPQKKEAARAIGILSIAFVVTVPYLIYTYWLTDRPFYWANSGGMSLYWMSTPYENEYGDWQSFNFSEGFKGRNTAAIRRNHEADYAEILQHRGIQMDSAFKAKAMENIRKNPRKYFVNCIANVNRLFFGFPNSYQYENLKFLKMFPNIFLVGLIFYSLFVSAFNLRRFPFEILFLAVFAFIYLGLSALVSAYPRMLLVITPVLLFWIAYCVDRTLRFRLTFRSGAP